MVEASLHLTQMWTPRESDPPVTDAADVHFFSLSLCVCVWKNACTCATRWSLFDKVSQLTVADEGAFRVLAVTVETDVWVQITFIHIWGQKIERTQVERESCHSGDQSDRKWFWQRRTHRWLKREKEMSISMHSPDREWINDGGREKKKETGLFVFFQK